MFERINRFFTRVGYLRAAGEMQRLGYIKQAESLKKQARELGVTE